MATVSTIEAFIAAVSTADSTVILGADLDFSTYNFTSAISIAGGVTIDGNGHKIDRINISGTNSAFTRSTNTTTTITIKNLSINNIAMTNGSGGRLFNNNHWTIQDCTFQGMVPYFIGSLSQANDNTLTRCHFSLQINQRFTNGQGTSSSPNNYSECYFDISSPKTDSYIWNESGTTAGQAFFNNCYFKGTIKYNTFLSANASRISNCVFNMFYTNPEETENTFNPFVGTSTAGPCLINGDRIVNSTVATRTGLYKLTDAQLKSADYITANTDFPLVN